MNRHRIIAMTLMLHISPGRCIKSPQKLDWHPTITFEEVVREMVEGDLAHQHLWKQPVTEIVSILPPPLLRPSVYRLQHEKPVVRQRAL